MVLKKLHAWHLHRTGLPFEGEDQVCHGISRSPGPELVTESAAEIGADHNKELPALLAVVSGISGFGIWQHCTPSACVGCTDSTASPKSRHRLRKAASRGCLLHGAG